MIVIRVVGHLDVLVDLLNLLHYPGAIHQPGTACGLYWYPSVLHSLLVEDLVGANVAHAWEGGDWRYYVFGRWGNGDFYLRNAELQRLQLETRSSASAK